MVASGASALLSWLGVALVDYVSTDASDLEEFASWLCPLFFGGIVLAPLPVSPGLAPLRRAGLIAASFVAFLLSVLTALALVGHTPAWGTMWSLPLGGAAGALAVGLAVRLVGGIEVRLASLAAACASGFAAGLLCLAPVEILPTVAFFGWQPAVAIPLLWHLEEPAARGCSSVSHDG